MLKHQMPDAIQCSPYEEDDDGDSFLYLSFFADGIRKLAEANQDRAHTERT